MINSRWWLNLIFDYQIVTISKIKLYHFVENFFTLIFVPINIKLKL